MLGISEGHNCTAALLRDGKIVALASEERFSRLKNDTGFPRQAVHFVLKQAGLRSSEIDRVVLSFRNPYPHFGIAVDHVDAWGRERGARRITPLRRLLHGSAQAVYGLGARTTATARLLDFLQGQVYGRVYMPAIWPRLRRKQYEDISRELDLPKERIASADHHLCHALSARFFGPVPDGDTLVLTLDGAGDDCCATVSLVRDGSLTRIAQTPNSFSLGIMYTLVTALLGMKSGEHEYKVMGLAPYADNEGQARLTPVFRELLQLDGLSFKGRLSTRASAWWLEQRLRHKRFDWIAGAVQEHLEALMTGWTGNALAATRATNVVCGGGVFMNVKANMLLKDLPGVSHFGVCPSSGDESTALGAAFHGYQELSGLDPRPLENVYLGPEYPDAEIEDALRRHGASASCRVSKPDDIDLATAQLLADGQVVARFQGRMEFGARALGNRSVLANPSDPEVVPLINHQIKHRDFWMPFAGTVLEESQDEYLVNPGRNPSPHMMLAFQTTQRARRELIAAIHPFDKTMRPQILRQADNPAYHRLIKAFQARTGIGAVLNTSFNIHGEPMVCSPDDALHTLLNSGLQHLAIGSYLVSKQ